MITQEYFLDMIPGESTPPVVHVSQFDENSRTLTFNLMKGGVAYEPTAGMSVTLDGAKPDGTAFSYPMTVNGSAVSIDVKTQMTVVSGHVKCEVSVSNVSGKIGSANFILAVEEAAIDDGAISETDIPIFEDLKNQAQQAAASAEQSASDASSAASAVSSIVPASAGTTGQVLTKTATGADWQDVDGLPAGGTTGQVLTKQSSTDGDADWETPTGGQWGQITGTLSNQTDLQTALSAKANASTLATIESTTTASKAYSVGDYLVLNGQLYEVTTAITSGETLTVGTNISATTVGDELSSLNTGLTQLGKIYRFNVTSGAVSANARLPFTTSYSRDNTIYADGTSIKFTRSGIVRVDLNVNGQTNNRLWLIIHGNVNHNFIVYGTYVTCTSSIVVQVDPSYEFYITAKEACTINGGGTEPSTIFFTWMN